jgi:hypothetical protein
MNRPARWLRLTLLGAALLVATAAGWAYPLAIARGGALRLRPEPGSWGCPSPSGSVRAPPFSSCPGGTRSCCSACSPSLPAVTGTLGRGFAPVARLRLGTIAPLVTGPAGARGVWLRDLPGAVRAAACGLWVTALAGPVDRHDAAGGRTSRGSTP